MSYPQAANSADWSVYKYVYSFTQMLYCGGLFALDAEPVGRISDGLQCATAYCRYLPINDKCQGPVWPNVYRVYPLLRLDSLIVARGKVLIEFDIAWLKFKLMWVKKRWRLTAGS